MLSIPPPLMTRTTPVAFTKLTISKLFPDVHGGVSLGAAHECFSMWALISSIVTTGVTLT